MPPLSVMIKPASSGCQLNCSYCFYRDLAKKRRVVDHGEMSPDTLETIVRKALHHAEGSCSFVFQGGEPMLVGLSFFQHLLTFQEKHTPKGLMIHNAIQTNGLFIDARWAHFLADARFLVGLSLDGHAFIHDQNRRYADGSGTHEKAMAAADYLRRAGVRFNVLSVVTKDSAKHPEKIYRFLLDAGFHHLQFIPCLGPIGSDDRGGLGSALSPASYGKFLKAMFDLWHHDRLQGRAVSIRYFDNLLGMLAGYPPESCGLSGICACQYVIEADGSVYPCDFYALDRWYMGNIVTDNFDSLATSPACLAFIAESRALPDSCRACKWLKLCNNGCKRNRDPDGKNHFCESYRDFFAYAWERLGAGAMRPAYLQTAL